MNDRDLPPTVQISFDLEDFLSIQRLWPLLLLRVLLLGLFCTYENHYPFWAWSLEDFDFPPTPCIYGILSNSYPKNFLKRNFSFPLDVPLAWCTPCRDPLYRVFYSSVSLWTQHRFFPMHFLHFCWWISMLPLLSFSEVNSPLSMHSFQTMCTPCTWKLKEEKQLKLIQFFTNSYIQNMNDI